MLVQAIRAGKLRSLESLIAGDDFRDGAIGLNYAQARYFCLFMQERDVLSRFYRRFRETQRDDPLGLAAVRHVFPDHTWEQLDDEFCQWVIEIQPGS
jgi:hypothetical protein